MSLQIKISLDDAKAPIWRRVVVPENFTFYQLHLVIQAAMGWKNCHLFSFRKPGDRNMEIGIPYEDNLGFMEMFDSRETPIQAELFAEKQRMKYEYDFGDSWTHTILLEKVVEEKILRPMCIKGKGACPPEDCGGIWGYYHMIGCLNDPKNEENESFMEWLGLEKGETWDETEFDLAACNAIVMQYEGMDEGDFE